MVFSVGLAASFLTYRCIIYDLGRRSLFDIKLWLMDVRLHQLSDFFEVGDDAFPFDICRVRHMVQYYAMKLFYV